MRFWSRKVFITVCRPFSRCSHIHDRVCGNAVVSRPWSDAHIQGVYTGNWHLVIHLAFLWRNVLPYSTLIISGASGVCLRRWYLANHFSQVETVSIPLISVASLRMLDIQYLTRDLDHHQLSLILDILGTPSLDDFYAITSQRSREYLRALPFRKKRPFSTLFPEANPLAVDLLEKCLTFSPKARITVEEALAHPYLAVSSIYDLVEFYSRDLVLPWSRRRTWRTSFRL